ncbi:hypothetical protein AK88_00717 [Plasmodium fragile]|uniref:Uncharacterized protein n=1 Tax=Plasmodium fragile TaxID=5857 RepID=A0A0D9QTZ3_PLAFR|nr:uncharacterized protein AK88_00717 [Plasmodium fragile]KJP89506.1 hypothetical protein AK88_00717 [Plasmodium fragile]
MKSGGVDKHFFMKPITYICDVYGQKFACLDKWNGNSVQMELATKSGSRRNEENQSDITTGDDTYRGVTNNCPSHDRNVKSPLFEKSNDVEQNRIKTHSSNVNGLQKDGITRKYLSIDGIAAYNAAMNGQNTEKNPLSIFKTESDKILEHIKIWKMKRSILSKTVNITNYVGGREIPSPRPKEVSPNYANSFKDKKRRKKKTDTSGTFPKKLERFNSGQRAHCNYAYDEQHDSQKNETYIQGKTIEGGTSHTMGTSYNNNEVKKSYLKKEEICFSQRAACNFNQPDVFHIVNELTMERKLPVLGGNCPRHKTPSGRSSCSVGDRCIPANIPSTERVYQDEQINQRKKRKIDTQSNRNALINRTNNCKEMFSHLAALRVKDASKNDVSHSSQTFSNHVNCAYIPEGHNQDIAFKRDLKCINYMLTNKCVNTKGSPESATYSYDIYEPEGRQADIRLFATPPNNLYSAKNVIKIGTSKNIHHSPTKKLNSKKCATARKGIQNEPRKSQNGKNGNKKALSDSKMQFELGKRNPHPSDEAAKTTRRNNHTKYSDNSPIITEGMREKKTSKRPTTHITHLGKTPESNLGKRPIHNITLRNEKGTFAEDKPKKRGTSNRSKDLPKMKNLPHSHRTKESAQLKRPKQITSTSKTARSTNKNVQAKMREKNNQSEVNKVKPTINHTTATPFCDEQQELKEKKYAHHTPKKEIQMDTDKNTKGIMLSSNFAATPIYNQLAINLSVVEGLTHGDSYASGQSKKNSQEKTSPCSSGRTEYASSVSSPGYNSSEFHIMEEGKKETCSTKRLNYKSQESLLYELIHTNDNKSRIKQFIQQSEGRQNACTNLCSDDATHRSETTEEDTKDVNVKTTQIKACQGKSNNQAAPNDTHDKYQKRTSNDQKNHLRKSHETLLYELINENDNRVKILNFLKRSSNEESSPRISSNGEYKYPKQNGHENDRLVEGAVKIIPHILGDPPQLSSHSSNAKAHATKCILPKWRSTRACTTVANKNPPKYTISTKYHNKYTPQNNIKPLTTKMVSTKEMKQKESIKPSDKIKNGHKLMTNKKGDIRLSYVQSRHAPHEVRSSRNPLNTVNAKGKDTQRRKIVTPRRKEMDYLSLAKLKSGNTQHDIPKRPKGIIIKAVHVKDKNENKKNIHSNYLIIKKHVDNRPTKRTHAEAASKVPTPSNLQKGQSEMENHYRINTNQEKIKKCHITQQATPNQIKQKTKGAIPEEQHNSKEVKEKTLQGDKELIVQDGTIRKDYTKHKLITTTDIGEKKRKLLSGAQINTRVKARKVQNEMIPKQISIQMMTTNWRDKLQKNRQNATTEKGQTVNSLSHVKEATRQEKTPSVENRLEKFNTTCNHILLENKNWTHFTNSKEKVSFCVFNKKVQKNDSNKDIQMSFSPYLSAPVVNPPVGQYLFSAFSNRIYMLLPILHLNEVLPFDEVKMHKIAKKQNNISHEGENTYLSSTAQALTKIEATHIIHFYHTEGMNCVNKWTIMIVQRLEIYHWSGKKANLVVMHGQTVCLNKVEEVKLNDKVKRQIENVDIATEEECKERFTCLQREIHWNDYTPGTVKNEDFKMETMGWENENSPSTIFITDPLVKCTIRSIMVSTQEGKEREENEPIKWPYYLTAAGSTRLTCTQENIPKRSFTVGRHICMWEFPRNRRKLSLEESKRRITLAKFSVMRYQITTLDMNNKPPSDKIQTKKLCTNIAKKGNKYVLEKKKNYELVGVVPEVQEPTDTQIITQEGLPSVDYEKGSVASTYLTNRNLKDSKNDVVAIRQIIREGFTEGKGTLMIEDLNDTSQQMESGTPVQLSHTNDNRITDQTTQPPNGDIEKEIFTIKQLIKEILAEMKNGLVKETKKKKSKNSKKEKSRVKEVNTNAGVKNLNKKGSKRKNAKNTSIEKVKEKHINVTASVSKMKPSTLEMERVMNALEKDCVMGISIEVDVQESTREVSAVSDVSDEGELLVGAELRDDDDDAIMLEDVLCRNDVIVGHPVSYKSTASIVEDVQDQDNAMMMENASAQIDVVVVEDVGRGNWPIMVNAPSQTTALPVEDGKRQIELPDFVSGFVSELEDYEPSSENKNDDAPCRDAKREEIRQEIKKLIEMVKDLKREYMKEMQKDCSKNDMEKEQLMITYLDETNEKAQIIDLPFANDGPMLQDSPTTILTLQMKGREEEKEFQKGMIKDHQGEQSYQPHVNKITTPLPEQINLKQKIKSSNPLDNAKEDNANTHYSRPTCTKRKKRFNERVKLKLMMRDSFKMGNSNEAKMKERKEKEKLKQIIKDILHAETIRIFLNDQAAENDQHEHTTGRNSSHLKAEGEHVNARGEVLACAKVATHKKAVTHAKKDTYAKWDTKIVNSLGANPSSLKAQIPQVDEDICDKINLRTPNDACSDSPVQGKEIAKEETQNENSSAISERNEKIKKLMNSKRVTLNENLAMKRAFFNAQKTAGKENITHDVFF